MKNRAGVCIRSCGYDQRVCGAEAGHLHQGKLECPGCRKIALGASLQYMHLFEGRHLILKIRNILCSLSSCRRCPAVKLPRPNGRAQEQGGETRGDKAVQLIKLMCVNHIENAVLDEVSAIHETRPLEMIADSCGFGWGTTCIQMSADLTKFKVLLLTGQPDPPSQRGPRLFSKGTRSCKEREHSERCCCR